MQQTFFRFFQKPLAFFSPFRYAKGKENFVPAIRNDAAGAPAGPKEEALMKFGHFDDQNKEYVITTPRTPLPWINYLGSED